MFFEAGNWAHITFSNNIVQNNGLLPRKKRKKVSRLQPSNVIDQNLDNFNTDTQLEKLFCLEEN